MTPDDQNQNVSLNAPAALAMWIAPPVTIMLRSYLSPQYLWTAKYFTSKADEIEQNHTKADDKVRNEHRAYVVGAIFSAVAFLEAAINELFKDLAEDEESCYKELIAKEARGAIRILWELTEGRNRYPFTILDKCQLILTSCGKDAFHTGKPPYQDADLVIALRNALTHYKPESYGGKKQHKFLKQFKGKFGENKLMAGCESSYFPEKCLGSGCADWVVKSATKLADEFFRRLGVSPQYQSSPN
jgi:hypothetical protein